MKENPPNARFWVHHGEGLVKLTLKPGEFLRHCEGGRTDEGWSWTGQTWEYDAEERLVRHSITTESQDCDGRHGDYRDFECLLEDLAFHQASLFDEKLNDMIDVEGVRVPKWERTGASQRDEFAEAMGY